MDTQNTRSHSDWDLLDSFGDAMKRDELLQKLTRIMRYLSARINEELLTTNDLRFADGYWSAGFIIGDAKFKVEREGK